MKYGLITLTLGVALLLAACETSSAGIVTGPQVIDHDGGIVFSEDSNAYVRIPAGAISPGEQIEISVVPTDATPPLHLGRSTGVEYEFRPTGIHFNSHVTIHTKYDERSLPSGVTPADLSIVLQSGSTGEWSELTDVVLNPQNSTVSGKTSHFSTAVQVFAQTTSTPSTQYQLPISGGTLTQAFAAYEDAYEWSRQERFLNKHHTGIDIAAGGAVVTATSSGRVWKIGKVGGADCEYVPQASTDRGSCGAFGNAIIIKHDDGLFSLYGHLKSWSVSIGQRVAAGQPIGVEGSTGADGVVHLHFEVRTFDEFSWPGPKANGELGNGYLISHPGLVDSVNYYIDPLTLMAPLYGNLRSVNRGTVRVTNARESVPVRPNPSSHAEITALYRTARAPEEFMVTGVAEYRLPAGAVEGCLTWYRVRANDHVGELTRWVPEENSDQRELYLRLDGPYASVPDAWICAEYQEAGVVEVWLEPVGTTPPPVAPPPATGPIWEVTPTELDFEGTEGGPHPVPTHVTVTNSGNHTSEFTISNVPAWIQLSSDVGSLAPGESSNITVGVDDCNFGASNSATLRIGSAAHTVNLAVTRQCFHSDGELKVQPTGRWNITGDEGGPFSTSSRLYSLTNTGGSAIDWRVTADASWLELTSDNRGTLQPGASTTVRVELKQSGSGSATRLGPGRHTAEVQFRVGSGGQIVQTAAVRLVIDEVVSALPETDLVRNSTFNGPANWTINGTAWIWNGGSESQHYSNPGYAALGVDRDGWAANNVSGIIMQTVTVPTGATRGRFSFRYNLTSTDTSQHSDPTMDDYFILTVTEMPCGSVGGNLPAFTYSPSDRQATAGNYRLASREFNVESYAGSSLCVFLGGHNDGAGPSVLRLDDVQLTVWGE